jgi:flagellar hook-length control protein FliK
MKIGAGADARALNLSLPSGAAESTDISALFDELLALNVSAQSGNAPSNANAQPNDTSAAPGQSRSSQTTPQNFMQALLSTTQPPAQASATAARPIPAQPGNSGFPRVAALVANPAWPSRTGAAPQAAPAAANGAQSKIVDIKQQVNAKSATPSSGMASAKTIADLLQSALSEAPSKAGSQTPANPAVQKPDVVMDARSFAKIASFVMPVAAKQGAAAPAASSATAQAPLIASNPVLPAEPAAIPQAASEPAGEFDADALPEQTEPDQNAASFADSNNVKFINSNGRLATPTIATTRTPATFAPPITVFDAIEGLRAAILPDQESAASPTLKMLAAAAQQSQPTPSATATPGAKTQSVSQTVSQPASDPKADLQIADFVAAASANPVPSIAQPTITAASDTKNAATPAQSVPSKVFPEQTFATIAPQASDVKLVIPAQGGTPPSVIAKTVPPSTAQTAVLPQTSAPSVVDPKNIAAPSVTLQVSVTQPVVTSAPPPSNAKSEIVQRASAPVAIEQTVPQDVQTPDRAPTHSQPVTQQISNAKTPALPEPAAADTKTLSVPVQSAPPVSATLPAAPQTSDVKAAVQLQSSQSVVEAKVIPQTAQPSVSSQPETQSQPIGQLRDAEFAPQKNSDPAPAEVQSIAVRSPDTKQAGQKQSIAQRDAKQTVQQPVSQHETKQAVSQQQDTPRDASADSRPDAQAIQQPVTAPQLVADVKDIVQSILATQVSTASVKTAPQSTDNTSARGSLASAFAAAAAKSKSQLSQSQPRAAQTLVNGKLSADSKDNSQPLKNAASAQSGDASDASPSKNQTVAPKNQTAAVDETPAIATKIDVSAPTPQTKNDAPVPTDITPDNAAQNPVAPQSASNAPLSPQTPITLPNDLGVTVNAVQQPNAPHTMNIAASVQVAPQSQNAAHTMQADLSALALSIAAKSLDGVKHFDIRLDPAELGRVQVRLSIDESGKAAAHLSAERPQTLELLQRDAPALTRALKDSGVDLSQNGLNFSLKGQNQQNGNGNGAPSRGTPLEAKLVTNPEASAIPLHIKTDNVRLDIHV